MPIIYSVPGTPEQNSQRLLELLSQDFELVRNRTSHQCELVGRFLGIVLLIERKLVRLLGAFDKQIDERMFGQKIGVYKDFLKAFDWEGSDLEISDFRALIAPMKEIKDIRDAMAHDLSKVTIHRSELQQTIGYVRAKRPDLYESVADGDSEETLSMGVVAVFGFLFSSQLAGIQCEIQQLA